VSTNSEQDANLAHVYLEAIVSSVREAVRPENQNAAEGVARQIIEKAAPVGLRAVAAAAYERGKREVLSTAPAMRDYIDYGNPYTPDRNALVVDKGTDNAGAVS